MIGAFRKIFSKSKNSADPPPNPKPLEKPVPPEVSQATLEKLRKAKAQIKQSEIEKTTSTSPPQTQAPNAKPEPPSPVPSASPSPVAPPPSAVKPTRVSVPEDLEDTLRIPFSIVLGQLPESAQNDPGMAQAGSEEINIPKIKVFEKLAEGRILFTLKELIQWAPGTSISSMEELGSTQIEFPLKDILSRLDLKTLPRRKNQRKTEVPKGIEPIFGPRGIAPGKSKDSAGAPPLNPTPSPVPETQTTTESKKTSADSAPQDKSSLDAFRVKPNETAKASSAKQPTPEPKQSGPSGSPTSSEKPVPTSAKPSSDSLKVPASPLAVAAAASGKPGDDSKPISFGGVPQSSLKQEHSPRPSKPIPSIGLQTINADDDQNSVEDQLPSLPSAASTKPPAAIRKASPKKEAVKPERDIPKSPSSAKLPEAGGQIAISVEKISGK